MPWGSFLKKTGVFFGKGLAWCSPPDIRTDCTAGVQLSAQGLGFCKRYQGVTEDELAGWHHRLSGHGLRKLWEIAKDRGAWCIAVHEVKNSQTWFSDWTTNNYHLWERTQNSERKPVTHHQFPQPNGAILLRKSHPSLFSPSISWLNRGNNSFHVPLS